MLNVAFWIDEDDKNLPRGFLFSSKTWCTCPLWNSERVKKYSRMFCTYCDTLELGFIQITLELLHDIFINISEIDYGLGRI